MKKTLVLLLLVGLMAATSVMAQHGMRGDRNFDAPRAPRHAEMGDRGCDGHGGGQGFGGHGKGMHQGRGMRGDRDGAPMIQAAMRFADEIGLTDVQKVQIKEARLAHELMAIDLKADIERASIQTKALMHDDKASEAEVLRAIDQVAQAKAEMAKFKYVHRKQMISILTDQQKAKLKELRKEKHAEQFENRKERFEKQHGEKKNFRGRRRG